MREKECFACLGWRPGHLLANESTALPGPDRRYAVGSSRGNGGGVREASYVYQDAIPRYHRQ
ncbi:MAG: hypothetical protein J7455_19390 [Roseiflexus sp.]|nr:hypothetical protein [Roseiflexus sp.]MBO9389090.1 hypothetical protein [Roseiflexus sp.]